MLPVRHIIILENSDHAQQHEAFVADKQYATVC